MANLDMSLIEPFTQAARAVLQGEVGSPVEAGSHTLETSPLVASDVTVLVGLAGQLRGALMLSMEMETVLRMASRMAGEELTCLDELAKSAVAELTNMVTGRATIDLEHLGYPCQISAPTVVTGAGTEITTTPVERVTVPLATPCGAAILHLAVKPA